MVQLKSASFGWNPILSTKGFSLISSQSLQGPVDYLWPFRLPLHSSIIILMFPHNVYILISIELIIVSLWLFILSDLWPLFNSNGTYPFFPIIWKAKTKNRYYFQVDLVSLEIFETVIHVLHNFILLYFTFYSFVMYI